MFPWSSLKAFYLPRVNKITVYNKHRENLLKGSCWVYSKGTALHKQKAVLHCINMQQRRGGIKLSRVERLMSWHFRKLCNTAKSKNVVSTVYILQIHMHLYYAYMDSKTHMQIHNLLSCNEHILPYVVHQHPSLIGNLNSLRLLFQSHYFWTTCHGICSLQALQHSEPIYLHRASLH